MNKFILKKKIYKEVASEKINHIREKIFTFLFIQSYFFYFNEKCQVLSNIVFFFIVVVALIQSNGREEEEVEHML